MLRHYDQIGLLKPASIDSDSGYRFYSIDQLPRINKVMYLKNLGFPLQVIAELVDEQISLEEMEAKLLKRQKELEHEISLSHFHLNEVKERLRSIQLERETPLFEVNIKSADAMVIASVREVVPHVSMMGEYCLQMHTTLYEELRRLQIEPLAPEVTIYHQDSYSETDIDMEVSTAIAGTPAQITALSDSLSGSLSGSLLTCRQLAYEPEVASVIYSGSIEGIEVAIFELLKWLGRNDWTVAGEMRELHVSGPVHQNGVLVERAVIELQLPIKKWETSMQNT
jgi:DNA-binding transcriptional MerR regulator